MIFLSRPQLVQLIVRWGRYRMYVNIAVLKETQAHERRVALVPSVAVRLAAMGGRLTMESGAGESVNLPDAAYKSVAFSDDRTALAAAADVVLAVQPPPLEVVTAMKEGSILISFIDTQKDKALVQQLLQRRITCFSGGGVGSHAGAR